MKHIIQNLPQLIKTLQAFEKEREWQNYNKPRNLALALITEVGELSNIFQWKSEETNVLTIHEWKEVAQELADITIFLVQLSYRCNTSLILNEE